MDEWNGPSSTTLSSHIQKIDPLAKKLVKIIESAKTEKVDPLRLLVVPEVPAKIVEIKMILDQIGY